MALNDSELELVSQSEVGMEPSTSVDVEVDLGAGTTQVVEIVVFSTEEAAGESAPTGLCDAYRFAVSTCITGSIFLVGFFGNVLCVAVLEKFRRQQREGAAATIVMQAVLVTNTVTLVTLTLMKSVPSLCAFTGICEGFFDFYPWLLVWGWPTATVAHALASWMTVLLTVHRYIAVCHPHKSIIWCTVPKVRVHVLLVVIFSVAFELPNYFDHYLASYTDPATNVTTRYYDYTPLGNNPLYNVIYKTTAYYVIMYVIPLTILAVMTYLLIRELRRAKQFRLGSSNAASVTKNSSSSSHSKSNSSRKATQTDINKILISIVLLFFITQPWEPIRRIIESYYPGFPACGDFRFFFDEIPTLMAIINSAFSFAIYLALGSQIRRLWIQIYCCCFWKMRNADDKENSVEQTISTIMQDKDE